MRFGLFYEHQLPRPWEPGAEHRLFQDALAQVTLADSLGYDYVWAVEHHFLEEYSHSSAPEVFLAAASQRTKTIRLGHGIVALPHQVNHPARVAERVATLDLVSNGRVDFGTGESSSASELGGFGVQRRNKREQWADALDAITRMFVEAPFAGWDSPWLRMPPRNVVPKPLQVPHPPLWVACSQRETIQLAARHGVGALSFSFASPEQAGRWAREYYDLIASPECRPAGFAVNANLAVVMPMMCHADEATAIERGADGARFFAHALAHYYGPDPHVPGDTDVHADYCAAQERRGTTSHGPGDATPDDAGAEGRRGGATTRAVRPLSQRILEAGTGAPRGAIGTPNQIRELLHAYADAGVDQVIFVMQAGSNQHEHICESIELFHREVMPALTAGRAARDAAKAERLAPAVAAALARRDGPRARPGDYRVDERADLSHALVDAAQPSRRSQAARGLRRRAGHAARVPVRALAAQVAATPRERAVARRGTQRALLAALASSVRRDRIGDFRGELGWRLTLADGRARDWTLCIGDGSVAVAQGGWEQAAVRIEIPAVALARVVAGQLDVAALAATDGVDVHGELELLPRLGAMFGASSPF